MQWWCRQFSSFFFWRKKLVWIPRLFNVRENWKVRMRMRMQCGCDANAICQRGLCANAMRMRIWIRTTSPAWYRRNHWSAGRRWFTLYRTACMYSVTAWCDGIAWEKIATPLQMFLVLAIIPCPSLLTKASKDDEGLMISTSLCGSTG
jgi:hypothetical protein